MRRFLTILVLLFVLLSQSQVLGVYAQAQASLNEEKQQASRTIDAVEGLIDNTVEKIDAKISHRKQNKNSKISTKKLKST